MIAETSPGRDAFGGELDRGREPLQLQLGRVRSRCRLPLLKLLGNDLADARGAHAFLGGDFLVSEALAQA